MEIKLVKIKKPVSINVILGQAHFIKTVEDVHECVVTAVPKAKFGLAFCEASGPRLIRSSGTKEKLIKLAEENAKLIGVGHSFVLVLENLFPINILPVLKQVPEIVNLFVATANECSVVVAKEDKAKGILGVMDGGSPLGVENDQERNIRQKFLRNLGYKLG